MPSKNREQWEVYREKERGYFTPILERLGFTLEAEQPHIGGERYVMRAVTTSSGNKLILLGKNKSTGNRVVIKVSRDRAGRHEIEHERECQMILKKIKFAYQAFLFPKEIFFEKTLFHTISIQEFLNQERPFLERPLEEQFSLALSAFKAQESAHATTYKHTKLIKKTFNVRDAREYLENFRKFKQGILTHHGENINSRDLLEQVERVLGANAETIEQYSSFLTHTDFVPHNFRVVSGAIYLLDSSSLCFGNKYEGWARFLNFMTLYNKPLEEALVTYVKENRTGEEFTSLKMMRLYRLGEIMWYYTQTLDKTEGNLRALNEKRVVFWSEVLKSILNDTKIPTEIIETYKQARDSLRDEEEKKRQIGLH